MRRILLPPLLALLLLGSLSAAPRAALAADADAVEAVVLTGADFPAWVAEDADVAADRLVGYRYDGHDIVRVPLRVHLVEDDEARGSSRRSADKADDGTCEAGRSGGTAAPRELRADDLVVLDAHDAGAPVPDGAVFPAGVTDPHEVVLRDREGGTHLYVALAAEAEGGAESAERAERAGEPEPEAGTCVTTAPLEEEESADAEVTPWEPGARTSDPAGDDDGGTRGSDGGDGSTGGGDDSRQGDGGGGRTNGDDGQDGTGGGDDRGAESRSGAGSTSAGDADDDQADDTPARAAATSGGSPDRDEVARAAAPKPPRPAAATTGRSERGEASATRPAPSPDRSTGSSTEGPVRRVAIGGGTADPHGDEADEADEAEAGPRSVPPTPRGTATDEEEDAALAPPTSGRPRMTPASEPLAVHAAGPLAMALAALGGSLGGVLLLAGLLVLAGHTLRRRLIARISGVTA